jgi:uncharacterized protein DUF397
MALWMPPHGHPEATYAPPAPAGDSMSERDLHWIKSNASIANNACVELAVDGDFVLLRHSRQPDAKIRYTRAELAAFFEGVRNHEFDHLLETPHPSS